MNLRTGRDFQKMIMAGLALFLVQLACGGVTPTDPRIPESLNNMVGQFGVLLHGVGAIPIGTERPPLITQIQAGSDSQLTTVSGLGSFGFPPTKIRLYRVQLQGCKEESIQGDLLGETITDAGIWTIHYNLKPNEVVGATQVSEGKESGLSNPKVIDANMILIDNSKELDRSQFEIGKSALLKGKSLPNACVVLQNQNMTDTKSTPVDQNGNWKIEVPIGEKVNTYKVYVEDFEDVYSVFTIDGSPPHMQWPLTDKDQKADGSCNFEDTKEKKEIRVEDCYYKFPISTWYGRNDFYVQTNRAGGFHNGLDIAGTSGSTVRAVANGVVFYVQISNVEGSGGNIVLIDHGAWVSAYMHLSMVTIKDFTSPNNSELVDPPRVVQVGDQIGEIGISGCSGCGPHLHFSAFQWVNGNRHASLKEGDKPPIPWLKDNVVFKLLNVNPPAGEILGSGENSTERLADHRVVDQPKEYFSSFDYWLVNWNEIRINEYGCASGTKFDELNKERKCVIPTSAP